MLALLFAQCSSLLRTIPLTRASIHVRQGARLSHFCQDLQQSQLSDCRYFSYWLKDDEFARSAQALKALSGRLELEGIFAPAGYSIRLLSPAANCAPECQAVNERIQRENARLLLLALLPAALKRLESLEQASGLTPYEQVILASIVEKEAVSSSDYDLVSSVFHRRLRRNMPLGSCPAVEYALGFHRPFLLHRDLKINSPFNLYVRRGLPPAPIAFFSDAALKAAGYPALSEYLFFVYDWTIGRLFFSSNFNEHEKNAREARRNYIRRYGKANLYRADHSLYYEQGKD